MQPPSDYKNAGTMMIISGAFNVLTSMGILIGLALSLIGLCVAPIWVLTLAGGVFEIVVGASISGGKPSRMGLSASVVGLVCSVGCGNVLGTILEILAMVSLGKPEVAVWLANPGAPALPPPGRSGGGYGPPAIEGPAEPAVSWSWDMPLAPKGKMHGSQ